MTGGARARRGRRWPVGLLAEPHVATLAELVREAIARAIGRG
jgi:hypothetical protein